MSAEDDSGIFLLKSERHPMVCIPSLTRRMLLYYADKIPTEVAGIALADIGEFRGRQAIFVSKPTIFPQKVTGGSAEFDTEEMQKCLFQMLKEGRDDEIEKAKVYWHSHVNMHAFFSGTDVAGMRNINDSWALAIVVTKRGEFRCMLHIFSPFHITLDDLDYTFVEDPLPAELATEADNKIKECIREEKPKYSFVTSRDGTIRSKTKRLAEEPGLIGLAGRAIEACLGGDFEAEDCPGHFHPESSESEKPVYGHISGVYEQNKTKDALEAVRQGQEARWGRSQHAPASTPPTARDVVRPRITSSSPPPIRATSTTAPTHSYVGEAAEKLRKAQDEAIRKDAEAEESARKAGGKALDKVKEEMERKAKEFEDSLKPSAAADGRVRIPITDGSSDKDKGKKSSGGTSGPK